MGTAEPDKKVITSFTSKQWTGKPGEGIFSMFLGAAILGLILCLFLMIFIPGLRSVGSAALFTAIFGVAVTALSTYGTFSNERQFLRGLTSKVNDTILELTGNPSQLLSVKDFRVQIEQGKHLPLLVNGISGLDLSVDREPSVKRGPNVVRNTRVIITVTPPEYGIVSFDRLLSAAAEPTGDSTGQQLP